MKNFEAGKITALSQNKINELICFLEKNGLLEKSETLKKALRKLSENDKIRIAFVGQYSSGKSSIISAMTGNQQIEIGSDVTTQDISFYEWGNFLLADTPGLHDNETHDDIANEAIKNSDLIVYCITSELFNKNTLNDYLNLAYDKGYSSKIILVINKLNSEATDNREELIKNYIDSINDALAPRSIYDVRFAFFDVKDYLKGVATNNIRRMEHSNFENFIVLLNSFLNEKGLMFKLTTPLYEAKNIIDETFIDCSENDLDLARRDTLTRLGKTVNKMRNRAAQDWDRIVSEYYADFIDKAYVLMDRIGEDNFDFEKEFDELSISANNDITNRLEEMTTECEEALLLEVENILSSKRAQFYIHNATDKEREDSLNFDNLKTIKSSNEESKKVNVKGVFDNSVAPIAQKIGENSYKIVEKVGHAVGVKFKPWGIIKASKTLSKVCKFLGPAADIISLGVDAWDTYKDNKSAKEYLSAIRKVRIEIDKYKQEQIEEWKKHKEDFIKEVYTTVIKHIDIEKESILNDQEKNNNFNHSLTALMLDFENLIQFVLTGKSDNIIV